MKPEAVDVFLVIVIGLALMLAGWTLHNKHGPPDPGCRCCIMEVIGK